MSPILYFMNCSTNCGCIILIPLLHLDYMNAKFVHFNSWLLGLKKGFQNRIVQLSHIIHRFYTPFTLTWPHDSPCCPAICWTNSYFNAVAYYVNNSPWLEQYFPAYPPDHLSPLNLCSNVISTRATMTTLFLQSWHYGFSYLILLFFSLPHIYQLTTYHITYYLVICIAYFCHAHCKYISSIRTIYFGG